MKYRFGSLCSLRNLAQLFVEHYLFQEMNAELSMSSSSNPSVDPALRAAALESKAWPFEEARKLLNRIEKRQNRHDYILFETGYGPSGLPHIGTFGEVARTTIYSNASIKQ